MGIIIVFANQKGGVGKTTTAASLGAFLAQKGKSVLMVDFDPQGNLSSTLGADKSKPGIYEVISGQITAEAALQQGADPNLQILASNIHLSGASAELVGQEDREYFLKKVLDPLKPRYDFILVDSPPSLDVITLNGLAAADQVYIPLQCEYFAMEGLSQLVKTIQAVQKSVNKNLTIGGIILTMYDSRTNLAQEVAKEAVKYFKDKVFRTIIPRNVHLGEAPSHGLTINRYRPGSPGAKAYEKLADEVLHRV
ncbi:MAG: ParA family protein [Spirochaetales bacterium]